MLLTRLPIQVHKLKNAKKAKDFRITNFLGTIQGGYFWISGACNYYDKFREQFLDWPQPAHDDILDACADSCDPEIVDNILPGQSVIDSAATTILPEHQPLTRYGRL